MFAEDGEEYEADLTEIRTEDCGNKSASVVFVGYGNVEQVWLDDLLESKPEERKAAMETFGLTEATADPATVDSCTTEADSSSVQTVKATAIVSPPKGISLTSPLVQK